MKKALQGVLSFTIALAVLEILSRAGWSFVRDNAEANAWREPWFVYSRDLGWERKPNFHGNIEAVERRFDDRGLLFGDQEKLDDTTQKKILFIGDSNTFGNDCPIEKTFVALVDSFLPNAVTINAGNAGYTSYQGKVLLAAMLRRFQPDAIVVSFNYNDRRYVAPPDLADGKEAFERIYELAQHEERIKVLEKSYGFRMIRFVLRQLGMFRDVLPPPADLDSLPARVSPEDYRRNLRAMAQLTRQRNIETYFLALHDNPTQTYYLRKGIEQLERGEPDSAIENLTIQTHQSTLFTGLARKYLKHALEQLGRHREAKQIGTIEKPVRSIHSGFPIFLDSEYDRIMRAVGRESGVEVIEGGAELNKRPSVYYDFCHFDSTGHRMIAELLAPRLGRSLARK